MEDKELFAGDAEESREAQDERLARMEESKIKEAREYLHNHNLERLEESRARRAARQTTPDALLTEDSLKRAQEALKTGDPSKLSNTTVDGRAEASLETIVSRAYYGGFMYAAKVGGQSDGLQSVLPLLIETASDASVKDEALLATIRSFPSGEWERRGFHIIRAVKPEEEASQSVASIYYQEP